MNRNNGNRVNIPTGGRVGSKKGLEIRNGSGGTTMKPTTISRPAPPSNIGSNGN